ncbi:hypothetical protein ACVWZP_001122 [Pseudomonas sp. TE36184]|jgi:hypothetical protein
MDPLSHSSRPAGAPEFVVFSHKQNEKVSLFCRPTLWRFAEIEFDPWVKEVSVNQRLIHLAEGSVPVALAFESRHSSVLVFSKLCLGNCPPSQIQKYADDNGFLCEVLDSKYLKSDHARYENYLLMLSYINKHRESLTARNLRGTLKRLPRQDLSLSDAMQAVEQEFPEKGAALVFELIRRGHLTVKNLGSTKLSGASLLSHGDAPHE